MDGKKKRQSVTIKGKGGVHHAVTNTLTPEKRAAISREKKKPKVESLALLNERGGDDYLGRGRHGHKKRKKPPHPGRGKKILARWEKGGSDAVRAWRGGGGGAHSAETKSSHQKGKGERGGSVPVHGMS